MKEKIGKDGETVMAQGYYTLEESANVLGISPDDLKQLARKENIRHFQDGGTWRFRIQDIQELVRRRTDGSDLELPGVQSSSPADSPVPRGPKPQKPSDDVFGFSLASEEAEDAAVHVGEDISLDKPSSSGSGKKSSSAKRQAQAQAGSDSDVRLVADGSDISFRMKPDSDVKVPSDGPKSGPRSSKTGMGGSKSPRPGKNKSNEAATEQPDSGVRLVPMDSDSDVRILGSDTDDIHVPIGDQPPKGATDSDIRLESLTASGSADHEGPLTEEINLDEELKKDEARRKAKTGMPKPKARQPEPPKKEAFELSDPELNLAPVEEEQTPAAQGTDSSSDFDLTPASESSSPLELGSSDDFKLEVPDDSVALTDDTPERQGPLSGVNLDHPADSGISLEQGGEGSSDSEFELTLEEEPSATTSKPATPKPASSKLAESEEPDSSEFELSLDVEKGSAPNTDSEFELTLDDTGGLVADEEAPAEEAQDKDIFETDFQVPALDEESGSEAIEVEDSGVADVDTDLENPDFELAIGDDDVAVEDDSGSDVVALDEEEAAATTVHPKRRGKKGAAAAEETSDDFTDLDQIEEESALDGEGADEAAAPTVIVQPSAPWGVLPVAVLFPCVIVMMLLGIMGFELVQSQQGYKPGFLTKAIGGLMGAKK
jgi:excisionase family DNA binding protein